jgi:hypothetical protein
VSRPARRGIAAPSKIQRQQSCKIGITAQKEPAGDNTGIGREDVLLEIHYRKSIIRSSNQQHPQQTSQHKQQQPLGKNTHQNTKQVSGQLLQANSINISATDDVFRAFTVVQKIMSAVRLCDKRKFAVMTKAVCRLLKNNTKNSS